jgi:hypothetical protein
MIVSFPDSWVACLQLTQEGQGKRISLASLRKYQIVSLLDVIEFQLYPFLMLIGEAIDICWYCRFEGEKSQWALPAISQKVALREKIMAVEKYASMLGLDSGVSQAQRLIDQLDRPDHEIPSYKEIDASLGELRSRVQDQIKAKLRLGLLIIGLPPFLVLRRSILRADRAA